jgi:uncharacterized SAM-binding protein YcdF (DUF218 family)
MEHETEIILKALLLPPGGLILLLFISLLFIRKPFGKLLLTLTIVAFYLLSTPIISTNLIAGLERHVFVTPEEILAAKAEAIVVLGGGLYEEGPEYGGDTIKGELLERVRYAAWLHKRTNLPIIVSGGNMDQTRPPEAKLAGQALKDEFGCQVLATEDQSKTTLENALYTSKILSDNGINKVALVTHAWHMPRAMRVFKQNNIEAIAAPTIFSRGKRNLGDSLAKDWLPSPFALRTSYLALHEYLGMVWYQVKELAGI